VFQIRFEKQGGVEVDRAAIDEPELLLAQREFGVAQSGSSGLASRH
jgi:hypothetical protein